MREGRIKVETRPEGPHHGGQTPEMVGVTVRENDHVDRSHAAAAQKGGQRRHRFVWAAVHQYGFSRRRGNQRRVALTHVDEIHPQRWRARRGRPGGPGWAAEGEAQEERRQRYQGMQRRESEGDRQSESARSHATATKAASTKIPIGRTELFRKTARAEVL